MSKVKLPVETNWTPEYQRRLNAQIEQAMNSLLGSSDQRLATQQHAAAKATQERNITSASGVLTVDGRLSNVFRTVLTENITSLVLTAPLSGQVIKLRLKQDATGGRTITWPADIRWVMGEAPTLSTGANAVDVAYLGYDEGDAVWEGSFLPDMTGTGTGWGSFPAGPTGPTGPAGPTGPTGPASVETLAGLGDVDVTGLADNQVLVYDLASLSWKPETPTAAHISDFSEAVDDRLNALIVPGNNIDVTYNDGAGTFTIDVEALTSADITDFAEAVDDRVSSLLVAGSNITLTYNDGSNTLTIASTGGGGGGSVATDTIWDTKGDIAVATGADTASKLASSGVNGDVLTVDTSTATGLKWAAPTGGGSGGGSVVFVGENTVTGSAATRLTLSGLDLSADDFYIFEIKGINASGTTMGPILEINGDTTVTNYYRSRIYQDNTTLNGARANNNDLAGLASGENFTVYGEISLDAGGVPRIKVATVAGTTTGFDHQHGWIYHVSATNVTSLSVASSVASGLGVGTSIAVWKRVNGSVGGGANVSTDTIWDAKGDIVAGTGSNAASRLAVGTDGYFLTADSSQATGLRWVAPSTSDGTVTNYVTANQDRLSTTTLADCTGLTVTLTANTKYEVEICLNTIAYATPDGKWDLNFTGTTTNFIGFATWHAATSLGAGFSQSGASLQALNTVVSWTVTGTSYISGLIKATIEVGSTGGTFSLRHAQNTSDGTNPFRVYRGSYIKARPL